MTFKHFLVLFSILCSAIALKGDQNVKNDEECPQNWMKIGTGCYLFATPENLAIDNACKLDGKILTLHHLKWLVNFAFSWVLFKGAQKKKPLSTAQ